MYSLQGCEGHRYEEVEVEHALVGHHVTTTLREIGPLWGEGLGLPCLVYYPWNSLRKGVVRVVEGKVDLVFCNVGGDIDREVVGYRGEDDDGANEDGSKETEEDIDSPSSKHKGREGGEGGAEGKGRRGRGRESEGAESTCCMRS